jgi:hypothetical protein
MSKVFVFEVVKDIVDCIQDAHATVEHNATTRTNTNLCFCYTARVKPTKNDSTTINKHFSPLPTWSIPPHFPELSNDNDNNDTTYTNSKAITTNNIIHMHMIILE